MRYDTCNHPKLGPAGGATIVSGITVHGSDRSKGGTETGKAKDPASQSWQQGQSIAI
jgi:hypothetical protein